jgi:hypothetical protein
MDRQRSALGDLGCGAADNLRWSFTRHHVAVVMHERKQTSTPELELSSLRDCTSLRRTALSPFSPSTPSVRARAPLTRLYGHHRDGCASPGATRGPAGLCASRPSYKSPQNRLCGTALIVRAGRQRLIRDRCRSIVQRRQAECVRIFGSVCPAATDGSRAAERYRPGAAGALAGSTLNVLRDRAGQTAGDLRRADSGMVAADGECVGMLIVLWLTRRRKVLQRLSDRVQ